MAQRGRYESYETGATLAEVMNGLERIWTHAESLFADGMERATIGAVIQPLLRHQIKGHLSNEYRLSREAFTWRAEWHVQRSTEDMQWRVSSAKPATDDALRCRNLIQLRTQLRSVARRMSDLPFRCHLEWLWDGDRLWIVQADRVPPATGPAPGDGWQPSIGRVIAHRDLVLWRHWTELSLDATAHAWNKVASLVQFAKADLPVPDIWQLHGADVIGSLARGEIPDGLESDLDCLCSGHIVVRTDVRTDVEGYMLPKTEAETNPEAVLLFMQNTAVELMDQGVGAGDIIFLAHRFLRARGCVWTFARPDSPFVQVDSTWGLNDGLSWLPHDSAWVNVESGQMRRSIEGKTAFLDVATDGSWTYREAPTEWIWRSSVTEDQLRTMATGAARLSRLSDAPLVTMWFVGLLDGAEAECVPWFQASHVPRPTSGVEVADRRRRRVTVRTREDLQRFIGEPKGRMPPVLRLDPVPALVRDKNFVGEVIDAVRGTDISVEIVGSPLAHPYYLLQQAGVGVTCVGSLEPPLTEHHKLVRDNIPGIIEAKGEYVVSYRASGAERAKLLKTKVVEEALELLRAGTGDELLDEMADVEEALTALRVVSEISRDELRQRLHEKRSVRGGFDDALVLVRTSAHRSADLVQESLPGLEHDAFAARSWRIQQLGNRLVLNSVPPLPDEISEFSAQLGGHSLRVRYTIDGIEISVIDAERVEPDQPSLF
jgi:predicted house-cleaning noncanonical NTP pyrophosphatase (MazG superfamily)